MELPQIDQANEQKEDQQSTTNNRSRKSYSRFLKYKFYKGQELHNSTVTVGAVRRQFVGRTSSQGIAHVSAAPGGCKKMIWILLSLATLLMLVLHLYHVFDNYLQFDTTTEVKVVSERTLKFPAVTICNNNKMRSDEIPDPELGDYEYDEMADMEEQEGHLKEDLIVEALFDNHVLDIGEFEHFFNPTYGNCYTFNKHNKMATRRSLPGYGVELLLNIESYIYEEAEYWPVEWVGAVVKVHHPDVEPVPEEGGVIVKPGTLSRLALTKTEIQRLGGKYGNCIRDDEEKPPTFYEGNYTKANCDNTCLQRKVISTCCCSLNPFKRDLKLFNESWPRPKDELFKSEADEYKYDVCRRDNVSSCPGKSLCWQIIWNRYDSGELRCEECRDQCNQILYEVSTSTVDWPAPNYLDTLYEKLDEIASWLEEQRYIDGLNKAEFVKQNLLKVQIHFDHMTTTKIREQPSINDFEFASELGGTFGLWVGWTVLTLFEFLEFLVDIIATRLINKPAQ